MGPSLAAAGISAPLPDPVLELHDANGNLIMQNDNWMSTQQQEIIDSGIPPTNNLEAAIVITLPPGSYTAVMHDSSFASGIGLIEVYDLEPQ